MTSNISEPSLSEQTLENLSSLVDGEASDFERRRLLDMMSCSSANNQQSGGLSEKWQSYHLIGAALRKELSASSMKDLSGSISEALSIEPTFISNQPHIANQPQADSLSSVSGANSEREDRSTRLTDWIAKSAIAASVAFAVVVGVQVYQNDDVSPDHMPVSGELAGMGQSSQEPAAAPVITAPEGFDLPTPVARNVSLGSLAEPQKKIEMVSQLQQNPRFLSNAAVEAELEQLFMMHAQLSSENGRFGLMPMARASDMPASSERTSSEYKSEMLTDKPVSKREANSGSELKSTADELAPSH